MNPLQMGLAQYLRAGGAVPIADRSNNPMLGGPIPAAPPSMPHEQTYLAPGAKPWGMPFDESPSTPRGADRFGIRQPPRQQYDIGMNAIGQDMQSGRYQPPPQGVFDPYLFSFPQQMPAQIPNFGKEF